MEEKTTWEDFVNLMLGAWVSIIPWSVSYSLPASSLNGAMWNFFILGLVVSTTAGLALLNIKPWKEWTNIIAGVWLMLSPWLFGYTSQKGLLWNSLVVGFAVCALSGLALFFVQRHKVFMPQRH